MASSRSVWRSLALGAGALLVALPGLAPAQTATQARRFTAFPALRPCCALGHDLRTTVGGEGVNVVLPNVLSPVHLGSHSYRAKVVSSEANGLVYTCRGGFIDVAHVRDYADLTAHLVDRFSRVLGSAVIVPLSPEAGTREVRLTAFEAPRDETARRELALALARRVAYEVSIWHEIVTWYGFEDVPGFSERASAFSPEDLPSNVLGTQVGASAILAGGDYDEAMDEALVDEIGRLVPLAPSQTREALDAVDGVWWDSARSLPDERLVPRRSVAVGDQPRPWLVPLPRLRACTGRGQPAVFDVPTSGPDGRDLRALYSLRFVVDRGAVPGLPMPDPERSWIGENDFPVLADAIRADVRVQFGPFGDSPDIDVADLGVVPRRANDPAPGLPCGADDPDCAFTRSQQVHGLAIGKLRLAGGNVPGPSIGFTLVDAAGTGGGFRILQASSLIDVPRGDFDLRLKAVSTIGALLFCSRPSSDGLDDRRVDFPFVNPFGSQCLGGSAIGVRLDVVDLYYDTDSGRRSVRPIDVGIVWNLLANGHTTDYLRHHLLVSVGASPESITRDDKTRNLVTANVRIESEHALQADRWILSFHGEARDPFGALHDISIEAGFRVAFNALLGRRNVTGVRTVPQVVTIGVEGDIGWWRNPANAMPGLGPTYRPPGADWIGTRDDLSLTGMLVVEAAFPQVAPF